MKNLIKSLVTVLFTGLFVISAHASLDVEFYAAHNTGTSVWCNEIADHCDVGNGNGNPTGIANSLWALVGPINADANAWVDSTNATGRYYIGYFDGGMDAYVTIY
ncbi:MAG: hypothetical protein JKY51_06410 [Opitutaceae bacterium]|nr:hypothetical protein [Opitutaceae bacterium]